MIQPVLIQSPAESRFWQRRRDADQDGFALFVRHYTYRYSWKRKWAGRKYVGPGEHIVLVSPDHLALCVWRKFIDGCIDQRTDKPQAGVNCSVFRNESAALASAMILDAELWATARWPGERLYTYVDPKKVKSRNPGYCFKRAGWRFCGVTKGLLHVLEKTPEKTPVTGAGVEGGQA